MRLKDGLYLYPEKGALDCNTYVIKDRVGIIIDPGSPQFLPELVADMSKDGIAPKDISIIINTHLHGDHCWGDQAFKELSGAKILSHRLQEKFYDVSGVQVSSFFGLPPVPFKPDGYLDGDKLSAGDIELGLVPSPGHSPDSICYYLDKEKALVSGDVVFDRNAGRTDIPGGDADKLKQSLTALSEMDIDYLLPGHMGIVSGAEEVKSNFEFINSYVFGYK
ncbi:MAG: MBL fold metallo-hydrolase [Chloroflexi bacterium]|nr:MBL fold metallo-hydrolase [Chloroflexota bacterium]